MIARSFKSVIWVATVGGAALSCYMVSLRVATERADLAKVERQIIAAKHDIRSLQTELGTRGRMTQLEDWNANVLALSAPTAAQFVKDDVMLARLEQQQPTVEQRIGEIRMASVETGAAAQPSAPPPAQQAEAPKPTPRVVTAIAHPAPPAPPGPLHQASYTPEAKAPLHDSAKPAKPAKPEAKPATLKPDRQAKADKKPVAASEAHAAADKKPVKSEARAKAEKKPAAKPDAHAKAEKKPAKPDAHAKAEKKPAKPEAHAKAEPKAKHAPAAKPAPEKKLAANSKPRHAAQESDAD